MANARVAIVANHTCFCCRQITCWHQVSSLNLFSIFSSQFFFSQYRLQAAWQANGGAKYRPIGVVNEVIAVTASVTNPLSIPIQLSRVRLLVGHEPLEGGALNGGIDAEGKATFEVQRVSQLLPPESTVIFVVVFFF